MRRKEFKSFLGFVNYHIFFTGLVFVKHLSAGESRLRLRVRTIKALFGDVKKNEIWKKSSVIEEDMK